MLQRVLWVSLTQALRSIALVLLPTAFISLLGWATAGSSNGNTTDPMRAALWLWLSAHHVPFNLLVPPGNQVGFLSYLPLGAVLFPFLAIRSGFIRARDRFELDDRSLKLMRITFALIYSAIGTLLAWGSGTTAVQPVLYFVPVSAIFLVMISSTNIHVAKSKKSFSSISLALRILAILFGTSSLLLGLSLSLHLKTIENLVVVLQPGWLGGVLLLLFNLLYLPNAVVATFSYLLGPGFAIGTGTMIAPLTRHIVEIPALPLLGALPTGRHPLVPLSGLAVGLAGIILFRSCRAHGAKSLAGGFIFIVSSIALLAYLGSGSLVTKTLGTVGVSIWQVTLVVAVEVGIGIFLAWLISIIASYFSRRRSRVK